MGFFVSRFRLNALVSSCEVINKKITFNWKTVYMSGGEIFVEKCRRLGSDVEKMKVKEEKEMRFSNVTSFVTIVEIKLEWRRK